MSDYSLFTDYSFDATKDKHDYYRGNDCMKNLYKDLKKHVAIIVNYEKIEMILLTNEEDNPYHKKKVVIYETKKISTNDDNKKSEIIIIGKYRGVAHNLFNLR